MYNARHVNVVDKPLIYRNDNTLKTWDDTLTTRFLPLVHMAFIYIYIRYLHLVKESKVGEVVTISQNNQYSALDGTI